jgi:hypothetical protein
VDLYIFFSVANLVVLAGIGKLLWDTRQRVLGFTGSKPEKISSLCKVVGKNQFGEWDRVGELVRYGSKDYHKALAAPGVALLHRNGEVEEGVQDVN